MRASFRSGGAAVALSHDLEGMARRVVEAAKNGAGRVLLADAESVASTAAAQWYQQVNERTGKSGRIVAVADITADKVIIKVGSTDTRTAKNGKPSVVYVHRPGALSVVTRPATNAEYHAALSAGKKAGEAYWVATPNKLAADGAFLLQTLVKAPFKRRVKASIKQVAKGMVNV